MREWNTIVHKICEETSTFDVLTVVLKHIEIMQKEFEEKKICSKKIEQAKEKIREALELIDPEF